MYLLLFLATLGITNPRANGSRITNLGIEFTYDDNTLVQEIHTSGENTFQVLHTKLSVAKIENALMPPSSSSTSETNPS